MTTILVDLRHGILVADAFQEHHGHMRVLSSFKSVRLPSGDIAAWSGVHPQGIGWVEWLMDGEERSKRPELRDATGILLRQTGECFLYTDGSIPQPICEPYYAIGSGAEFVLGAMYVLHQRDQAMNVSRTQHAIEAMRVACHFDTYTAYPLTVYDIKQDTPTIVRGG